MASINFIGIDKDNEELKEQARSKNTRKFFLATIAVDKKNEENQEK